MLTFTRRDGQRIMIGDDIIITVVEVRGRQARISIQAPEDVRVDREEVREAMDTELT